MLVIDTIIALATVVIPAVFFLVFAFRFFDYVLDCKKNVRQNAWQRHKKELSAIPRKQKQMLVKKYSLGSVDASDKQLADWIFAYQMR